MKRSFIIILGLLFCMTVSASMGDKKIYGLIERVQFLELDNVTVKAKFDTGAVTSSLGATDIHLFKKDGKDWVSFKVQLKGDELTSITKKTVEKEVVRYSNIKVRHENHVGGNDEITYSKRPVVLMDVCFDGVVYPVEVNLTDRNRFSYAFLVGSKTLTQFNAIVDASKKYQATHQQCK